MSYLPGIVDAQTGDSAAVSAQRELKVEQVVRLCGVNFVGATIDANFWLTTLVGTGSATQVTGKVTLATGATANSSAAITSARKGRFYFACMNEYRGAIKLADTGVANNTKKWGAFSTTDGLGFVLAGTTFGVFTRRGSTDTTVNSGSFNGPGGASYTLDANVHFYEIIYYAARVEWYIDGVLIHTARPTTVPLVDDLSQPASIECVNSGGSTTNVSMEVWYSSILRLGGVSPRPQYVRITTNTTTVCKRGAGTLHKIIINTPGTGGNTITLYDNTAASGTIIAALAGANTASPEYLVDFQNGLTVVTATGGAPDLTVTMD